MTDAPLNHVRRGTGPPLVLVHGLGGSWRSWGTIIDDLAAHREVIAVDLPGFGDTPPLAGEVSIATLTEALQAFLTDQDLDEVDTVGSSMGARIVLELARRGVGGDAVALDPGGFWTPGERRVFSASLRASMALVRGSRPRCRPCWATRSVGRRCSLSSPHGRGRCGPRCRSTSCAASWRHRRSTPLSTP